MRIALVAWVNAVDRPRLMPPGQGVNIYHAAACMPGSLFLQRDDFPADHAVGDAVNALEHDGRSRHINLGTGRQAMIRSDHLGQFREIPLLEAPILRLGILGAQPEDPRVAWAGKAGRIPLLTYVGIIAFREQRCV